MSTIDKDCENEIAVLQHEFIANSHSTDVVRAISLDGGLDQVALPCVSSVVVCSDDVVSEPHRHVDLGLFDSFKLVW